ncbi:hypothetical protein A0J48_024625 [Sphaerospermopsis aphanizomenoides BCCUSP55]|uniref:hypothetical protein n=1 Tax=Sphaerospermopsis aphanizomenoides TaxID=459663 RepID=UPI001908A40A|nr:hypothetical protein [Sphaerospermopsis aphanizomenoides]MBK1990666.1 hypothetical protein [Sphaerospermopsis aphanizomenoides BCCUSP55]
MSVTSNYQITIAFTDTRLDDEEKNQEVQKLRNTLKLLDEAEKVRGVIDPNPPKDGRGEGLIPGWLIAEVKPANALKLFGFLKDRLVNQPIEFYVKAPDGREIKLKFNNKEEFDLYFQKAQDFFNHQRD